MAITPIGSTAAASSNNLTLEDFLKVMLTQLTHQNPLKPVDNQEFMAQIAQFTALKQTQEMSSSLQTLTNNQSALHSVGLIGKTIEASTDSGLVTGVVTSLSLANAQPTVSITQSSGAVLNDISISQILTVE